MAPPAEQHFHFALGALCVRLIPFPRLTAVNALTDDLGVVSTVRESFVKGIIFALPMSA